MNKNIPNCIEPKEFLRNVRLKDRATLIFLILICLILFTFQVSCKVASNSNQNKSNLRIHQDSISNYKDSIHLYQAYTSYRQKVENKIDSLTKEIRRTPANGKLYHLRSREYASIRMRNDASLDLKRYIEIEPPKTSRDYECLSLDFEMLDNHEQALQYAKLAYAATTDSIQEGICLFMIGSIYHLYYHHGWIENYDKALEYYSKGLSLLDQPDNYAPDELSYRYRKRAKLFSELGMHDKAIVDYQRAIKLSNKKNDYMLQREIGKALLKMGNYEDAIHHYLSSDLPCNYELATAYGLAGDKKNMKKYFRKYLSESNPPCGIYASIKQSTTHLDPADVEFVAERKAFVAEELYEMGVANAVLGNKKIAIDNFRKSFKMLPETKLLETDLLLLSSYQHLVCR